MLSNPFSEEAAQRYINEFTTWPHNFPPHQIVYAGFRANPWPGYPDNAECHFCGLECYYWTEDRDPLHEHLRDNNPCPHAIRLQAKAIAKEEAIKQIAIAKELTEEERKSNTQDLIARHDDPSACDLHHGEEARLLHFFQDRKPLSTWQLSSPRSKGMPVDMALGRTLTPGGPLTDVHDTKLLRAITEAVGEGGIMNGWQIHAISQSTSSDWTATPKVNVLVVKKKAVKEDNTVASKSETISEWIPTPESSVVDGSARQ
ncbi:MAG: hypothetical protein Q9200_005502 [Gallowayella weberi]